MLLVAWGLTVLPAQAHWADQSVAEIMVNPLQVRIVLTVPTSLVTFADDNQDGQLSTQEVQAHREELETFLARRLNVADGGAPGGLTVQPAPADHTKPGRGRGSITHSTLLLTYRWSRLIRAPAIDYGLFVPGTSAASCLATIVQGGRVRNFVFTPQNHTLTLGPPIQYLWHQSTSFIALGIQHILTGYDHMLFLISLLMLGGGLRSLLKIVTAFTLAHSVTLSLAAFSVVTLPSRLVESGIALSIAYVALENLWRGDHAARARWLVTFTFGLIHGLGFASILKEMAFSRGALALSLVSFNFGVELGQMAVVTAAYLGLQALTTFAWESTARRWVSAAAAAIGIFLFVQRAFLA